jgi:hypothetical protein
MAHRIYRENNYFFIDLYDGEELVKHCHGHAKEVKVQPPFAPGGKYYFKNVEGINPNVGYDLEDLADVDGTAFADEAAWQTFYTSNTGNFNGGGSAPKQFVMYVGGQDATGFLNTDIRKNDFDFTFGFTRTDAGAFSISNYDPQLHRIESEYNLNPSTYSAFYNGEEGFYQMLLSGNPNDEVFSFGGYITITEYSI